jgi:hypothetical protein
MPFPTTKTLTERIELTKAQLATAKERQDKMKVKVVKLGAKLQKLQAQQQKISEQPQPEQAAAAGDF